jgi:hypothetical protein
VAAAIGVEVVESGWRTTTGADGQYHLVPAATLRITRNRPEAPGRVQVNVVFVKAADGAEWGNQWIPSVGDAATSTAPVIEVSSSHGHVGRQAPAEMFSHAQFMDARLIVLCRLGSAQWTRMLEVTVPRAVLVTTKPAA